MASCPECKHCIVVPTATTTTPSCTQIQIGKTFYCIAKPQHPSKPQPKQQQQQQQLVPLQPFIQQNSPNLTAIRWITISDYQKAQPKATIKHGLILDNKKAK